MEQRKSKIYDQKIRLSRAILTGIFFVSRRIHVYVDDVNEFIPLWSEQEYNGQLEEGDLSSFILQVKNNALWAKWSYFIILGGLAALNLIFSVISG